MNAMALYLLISFNGTVYAGINTESFVYLPESFVFFFQADADNASGVFLGAHVRSEKQDSTLHWEDGSNKVIVESERKRVGFVAGFDRAFKKMASFSIIGRWRNEFSLLRDHTVSRYEEDGQSILTREENLNGYGVSSYIEVGTRWDFHFKGLDGAVMVTAPILMVEYSAETADSLRWPWHSPMNFEHQNLNVKVTTNPTHHLAIWLYIKVF